MPWYQDHKYRAIRFSPLLDLLLGVLIRLYVCCQINCTAEKRSYLTTLSFSYKQLKTINVVMQLCLFWPGVYTDGYSATPELCAALVCYSV